MAKDMHVCTYYSKNGHVTNNCWTKKKYDKKNKAHVETMWVRKDRVRTVVNNKSPKKVWVRKDRVRDVSKDKEPKKDWVPHTKN